MSQFPQIDLSLQMNFDTSRLETAINNLVNVLTRPLQNPHILKGLEDAHELYFEELSGKFVENSQGGGDWAPLARRTQNTRFRQGFMPSQPILVRYGFLLDVLRNRNAPGRLHEILDNSIRDGYGGNAMQPPYADGSGGKVTIAQIAFWQEVGTDRSPPRTIFHEPSQGILRDMTEPILEGLRLAIAEAIK